MNFLDFLYAVVSHVSLKLIEGEARRVAQGDQASAILPGVRLTPWSRRRDPVIQGRLESAGRRHHYFFDETGVSRHGREPEIQRVARRSCSPLAAFRWSLMNFKFTP